MLWLQPPFFFFWSPFLAFILEVLPLALLAGQISVMLGLGFYLLPTLSLAT